jgi:hypothetical protein
MRIDRPLLKLPIRFCGDTLAAEVKALPAEAWMAHPQQFDGNMAVPLVSPGGAMTDQWAGPMAPTEFLDRCPYIGEVMQELDATWGRSRLMGLAAGAVVPEHVDVHYYWRTHLRIHVPAITNPEVAFTCAGETIHMNPGECWLLDSFYRHSVANRGTESRVHLVLDTVGSSRIWDLMHAARAGNAQEKFVAPRSVGGGPLAFEQINAPVAMSPWEMKSHLSYLLSWVDPDPRLEAVTNALDRFQMSWAGVWARFGTSEEGLQYYVQLVDEVTQVLIDLCTPPILMRNRWALLDAIRRSVLANAVAQDALQPLPVPEAEPQRRMSA